MAHGLGRTREGSELDRVRAGVALLSASALAALFCVAATSGRDVLLAWGPPSIMPAASLQGVGGGAHSAAWWGEPRMRPARAQHASMRGAEPTGRHERTPGGLPSIKVEVNQDHDEGDRIEPVNINIQFPARGVTPSLAVGSTAAGRAKAPRAGRKPTGRKKAQGLNSKAAVDEIDADGDGDGPAATRPVAGGTSTDDESARDVTAVEAGSEEHEAEAVFSPEASGASTQVIEAPKLPAMWLVGSPGQPHSAHDSGAKKGSSGRARGGKHAKDGRGRAEAAAKIQALHMSQLAQVSERELRSQHLKVAANGAVVVPLPDFTSMPGRQLVALEETLKFEERDARDSATTMSGVDRAKALASQLQLVRKHMARLPVEIETKLAQNEVDMAKKQREIQVLQSDIQDEEHKLDAARKAEGPTKLRRQEREMQANVELQRAAASALADLKGAKEPKFDKLSAPSGSDSDDAAAEAWLPSVSEQEKEVELAKTDLAHARMALMGLEEERASLLKDMSAVHKALRGDSATDEFGDDVGQQEWLKATKRPGAAQLAAERSSPRTWLAGRATMLAEQGQGDEQAAGGESAEVMQNVSKAWDDYMDVTDPSHINEGDVRHDMRKGVAKATHDAAKSFQDFAEAEAAPDFKTIDPEKDGWEWGRKHREVMTPLRVKQLASKGVGVGKEGPKLQFCQWGSEQVPCAPGYGGAWIEDHPQDSGIWDEAIKLPPKPKIREHVKAGKRSAPYLSDMFSYGQAGIFGARRQKGQKAGVSGVFKGAMLHGGKDRQTRIKSSIPQVWGLPRQEGGKYIENTQWPGLVKQEFDWHLNRMNEHKPEWADTLLESGKQIHLAKRLDFGNRVPAKGWDSLASRHAASVAGIVSPGEVDAMLDRDAISRSNLATQVVGKKKTGTAAGGWVNKGARNAARLNIVSETGKEGGAKAAGWTGLDAKTAASVFGIVNPSDVERVLQGGQLAAATGYPIDENVPRGAVGGQGVRDGFAGAGAQGESRAERSLDSKLRRAEAAEMRKLDGIASVSLS